MSSTTYDYPLSNLGKTTMSGGTPPTISVIMPVYNGMPYLPMAIDSIIGQTVTDWELIIIVNGRQKDNSAECAQSYADKDSRIKLLFEPKQGISFATNTGIAHARGKFLAMMDQDDVSLAHRFELQIQLLLSNPHIAVVGGYYQTCNADGIIDPVVHTWSVHSNSMARFKLLMLDVPIPHNLAMTRKSKVMQAGLYRETAAQDPDLWFRLVECGEFRSIARVLLYYRRHGNNTSKNPERFENHIKIASQFLLNRLFGRARFDISDAHSVGYKTALKLTIGAYRMVRVLYLLVWVILPERISAALPWKKRK